MRNNRTLRTIMSLVIALTMVFSMTVNASAASDASIKKAYTDTADSIYSGKYLMSDRVLTEGFKPAYGSVAGEWVIYGLSNYGYPMSDDFIKAYVASCEKAVEDSKGILHNRKYTDYSRIIVAYTALGLDPTNILGYNMVDKLADFDKVIWQGLNGPIWALIALDSGKYQFTEAGIQEVKDAAEKDEKPAITTRAMLINHILNAQLQDGGWNLHGTGADSKEVSDVDTTAMALGALAPYLKNSTCKEASVDNAKVKAAIDKAVTCLSKLQHADGSYSSYGAKNSESCSQVIWALSKIGINPNTDSRFKKNGKSVVDGLLSFYDSSVPGFRHVNVASGGYQPVVNAMATEQAFYALAEYKNSVPDKVTISTAKKTATRAIKVTWKKVEVCSGYQVVIANNSSFTKNKKIYTVSNKSTLSKSISSLTKGKTYYVKVRAYKTINGKKLYGAYSACKKVIL